MNLGDAVKEARTSKHLTQTELGQRTFMSHQMVSAIETGRKGTTVETMRRLIDELDDPAVAKTVAGEVTGGIFSGPWLDGELVDLHRMSVRFKVVEELDECKQALDDWDMTNKHRQVDKDKATEMLLQVIDAEVAIETFVAVICREYGLSIRRVYAKHREKLRQHGYIRGKL